MEICEDCRQPIRGVVVVMEPGADGKEWYRCVRCHRDGASPVRAPIATHAGTREQESPAKEDVASFERPAKRPRKKKRVR